ncbi:MAG: PqqD family protein [Actinomycetota bacterium]|jgi:hypothetical protein|nr:PqqD family protein [Actinomycetota bacterium]
MTAGGPGPERRPRRVSDLEISQIVDGYVVYDPATDRVHYLNHTAAVVIELCDGELTVDRIIDLVQGAWDLPERPVDEVEACVARFEKVGLVVDAAGADAAAGTAGTAADGTAADGMAADGPAGGGERQPSDPG